MNGVGKAQRASLDVDVLENDQCAGDGVAKIRGGNEEYRCGQQPPEPTEHGSRPGTRAHDDDDGVVHVEGTAAKVTASLAPQMGVYVVAPCGGVGNPSGVGRLSRSRSHRR